MGADDLRAVEMVLHRPSPRDGNNDTLVYSHC